MLIPTPKETFQKIKWLLSGRPTVLSDSYSEQFDYQEQEKYLTRLEKFEGLYTKELLDSLGVSNDCYTDKQAADDWLKDIISKIGYTFFSSNRFTPEEEIRIEYGYKVAFLIYKYLRRKFK